MNTDKATRTKTASIYRRIWETGLCTETEQVQRPEPLGQDPAVLCVKAPDWYLQGKNVIKKYTQIWTNTNI